MRCDGGNIWSEFVEETLVRRRHSYPSETNESVTQLNDQRVTSRLPRYTHDTNSLHVFYPENSF